MAAERCIKGPCSYSGWRVQGALELIQRAPLRLVQRRHLGRQTAFQMIQQQKREQLPRQELCLGVALGAGRAH